LKSDLQGETTEQGLVERRRGKDRRHRPTPMLSRQSFFRGRRFKARREEDRRGGYYVDRYGWWPFVLFMLIILLNALDGLLAFYTLRALEGVNNLPLRIIRDMGAETFILAAFALASVCTLFLFIHKNFPVAQLAIGAVVLLQALTISAQLILILFSHTP